MWKNEKTFISRIREICMLQRTKRNKCDGNVFFSRREKDLIRKILCLKNRYYNYEQAQSKKATILNKRTWRLKSDSANLTEMKQLHGTRPPTRSHTKQTTAIHWHCNFTLKFVSKREITRKAWRYPWKIRQSVESLATNYDLFFNLLVFVRKYYWRNGIPVVINSRLWTKSGWNFWILV